MPNYAHDIDIEKARGTRAEERFWSKVDASADCWVWTKGTHNGYGTFWFDGRDVAAHRFSWVLASGNPEDKTLVIDHRCKTLRCVNPAHLDLVAQGVNAQRGGVGIISGARGRDKTHCAHGHEYTGANTYRSPKTGRRQCRTCRTTQKRRRA